MEITVNQQSYSVSEACTIQQMLDTVLLQPAKGIAVAVNQEIIAKSNWSNHFLESGDNITIIKATQGG
jgi:sulfur carrier protein